MSKKLPAPQLYDLDRGIGESIDVASQHAKIVNELLVVADRAREGFGDCDRIGSGARFFDTGEERSDVKRWRQENPGNVGVNLRNLE